MSKNKIPKTLEEALMIIQSDLSENSINEIKSLTESKFVIGSHHNYGAMIRNNWYLWWHENNKIEGWPKKKPALTAYFNELGIYHGDDLSSIILTSLYRKLKGKDLDITKQVNTYKKFWKRRGFENGIYTYEKNYT